MRIVLLIIAGFFAIAGCGFYVLMSTIREDVERQYSQASEEPLVDFAHLFASLLEQDIAEGQLETARFEKGFSDAYRREFLAKIYQLEKTEIHTHIYITDAKGIVIFDSEEGQREGEDYSNFNDVYLAARGDYGVRASRSDPDDPETTVFYVAAPVFSGENFLGTLTVSRPETAMAPFAEESRRLVLEASVLTAGIVLVLGTVWAYLILHPIRKITREALRIAKGEQVSLPATGVGELRLLSLALEEMRRELEGKHYVENYVQALTHELKSPLAAIRGAAELIDESMPPDQQRRFLDNILNETSRSEDMVRRLVQLAAVESQTGLEREEPVSLSELVEEELSGLSAIVETKNLEVLRIGLNERASIEGDPLMLRIAVRNVLGNAFDFSPEGGQVEVKLAESERGITLTIRDEGPGIPEYAEGRVFERFYSLKNEVTGRKGSGIGLSFVQSTMELHGGGAKLSNRKKGGAVMELRFPEG